MRRRNSACATFFLIIVAMSLSACSQRGPEAGPVTSPTAARQAQSPPGPLRDEIPPAALESVMRAHFEGLGHMERYEYDQAAEEFRAIHDRAPGWIPGSINLAIALLNHTGNQAEGQGQGRAGGPGAAVPARTTFEEALDLLDGVLQRSPENLHAHYCRGIILEYLGRLSDAHRDFLFVAEHDPSDAHAWYKVGSTLADSEHPDRPAGPKQARELIAIYTKAIECNPCLVSALYKLQSAYAWAGDRAKQTELLALWQRLNPKSNTAAPGDTAETFYGEMGRYAAILNPFQVQKPAAEALIPPRFDVPSAVAVTLAKGDRWATADDLAGPLAVVRRVRARFGAAAASLDANGDGRLDLYLPASILGPRGVRDALLINRGEGKFDDATRAFGLPEDRVSLGVAVGDFDADRRLDLCLTGVGDVRLYRNLGERFEDVTRAAGIAQGALSLTARWLDLDQDGDLDVYVVNYAAAADAEAAFTASAVPGLTNAAYRNDGKPTAIAGRPQDNWAPLAVAAGDLPATTGLSVAFSPWPDSEALTGGKAGHTAVAALDLDDDRDLDLVLAADGETPRAVLNDRLGRFHRAEVAAPPNSVEDATATLSGLLVTDLDKDGRPDLVAVGATANTVAWRNVTARRRTGDAIRFERWPADARDWHAAVANDLDLDTWPDLVGFSNASASSSPAWARNDGTRLSGSPLALGPDEANGRAVAGFVLADLLGDPLPDLLVVREGVPPRLARNLGNGRHWLSLDLSGRWKVAPDHMRTNPQAIGTRLSLEGQGVHVTHDLTTTAAGLAQSAGPIVLGLGTVTTPALLRLRWPDGTMQCELNVAGDRALALAEHNRKTGSCPVLFTWNGERFVCLGDFLGGGGLGYLIAPGVYGQPDRDESVAITTDQLREENGTYRLAVTEPMDEVAYLDYLMLDVVDRPPGVSATPDERFAPEGPRPTGAVVAWRVAIEPARATDLRGRDVAEALRAFDRRTVDGFRKRPGWIGYAEEHGIVLDFGDRLAGFGAEAPLVLCLAGWVEYPYSQTNYAAATAGERLRPPAIERLLADGTWRVIEPNAGYPAGLPRMTTLDLSGKLGGPSCVLRIRTTMECYWDQAFVAVRDRDARVRVTALPVARGVLGDRGYTREVSPDGRLPLTYDYDHVDPAPLARMAGRLTRFGDVARLLRRDDDQVCLVGPGDELRLEFDANAAPLLPSGWTRSFVLRAVGYCKDADPFTAGSDAIGPLPWRGMPAYPFGPEGNRPRDAEYDAYLRDFQTRAVGER